MDVLKFMKERMRMCDYYDGMDDGCNACPRVNKGCELSTYRDYDYIKEYIADVEKWSKDHPLRTRLQDLLEKYPDAEFLPDGQPVICCARLGYREYCGKSFGSDDCFSQCRDCWNTPVEEDETDDQ